jgi:endonuclease/exonuclease/phosphatase family metal-dependent hydrolase
MWLRKTRNVIILLTLSSLTACSAMNNYLDPNQPQFRAEYAIEKLITPDQLRIISFNIQYSEKISDAIKDLAEIENLQNPDIILLQEMDEDGVDQIAKTLELNYIYYPASLHAHHKRNFGNAILSLWPITDSEKVILPHANPKNQQRRIAVKARLDINGINILTYSVHTETFWLRSWKRFDQVDTILKDVEQSCRKQSCGVVLVGGDFNSLTSSSVAKIDHKFSRKEFERATVGAGSSLKTPLIKAALDHIYVRGTAVLNSGKVTDNTSSDHYPLWVVTHWPPAD